MARRQVIHIAVVSHRHGVNLYASKTEKGLEQKLYEYVCEWWSQSDRLPEEPPKDHTKAIQMYFEDLDHEWCDCGTDSLE